ncbi:MAG: hypothetical protein WBX15_13445 [Thermoanaerobaculia bacterium]
MRRLPLQLGAGLALVTICWPLNSLLPGLRTHLLFFPLWLGYILTVDGLVFLRSGSSIFVRSKKYFALLFIASIPLWWIFELVNLRTRNWHYVGREYFSDLAYAVLASIAFSTVIPAVFETGELWRTFRWTERFAHRTPLRVSARTGWAWFTTGIVLLALLLLLPRVAYPLTWLALLFLVDPIAWRANRGSLLEHLGEGDYATPIALALGALTCGFFWEMWNWFAYPYWTYTTPGVEFWYLFQMPALGYLGYLPFGLELHSVAHLLLGRRRLEARG